MDCHWCQIFSSGLHRLAVITLCYARKHSKCIDLKQQPFILTLVSVIQLGVCCCTLAKLVSYTSSFHCVSTYFLIASWIKLALCMLTGARLKRQHLLRGSPSHGDSKSARRQDQSWKYISSFSLHTC